MLAQSSGTGIKVNVGVVEAQKGPLQTAIAIDDIPEIASMHVEPKQNGAKDVGNVASLTFFGVSTLALVSVLTSTTIWDHPPPVELVQRFHLSAWQTCHCEFGFGWWFALVHTYARRMCIRSGLWLALDAATTENGCLWARQAWRVLLHNEVLAG